jgi:Polyketide cyclase / dehydrase and lipid transport
VYMFQCEATFEAEPAAVWKAWTDVPGWPDWDLTKEIAKIDGPFAPGVSGWAKQRGNLGGPFTVTAVEPLRRWTSECPCPLGKVVFDHMMVTLEGGRVRVTKSVEVIGGFAPLFRLILAARMRRDITGSLEALGRQAHD